MIQRFEREAEKAAEYRMLDEERSKAFINGARWVLATMERDIYSSHHPMASASDNAYLDKLTLKDIKRFIKYMREPSDRDTNPGGEGK